MINCKEINDYIEYVKNNPNEINEERKLLIENIVKPLLKRDDVFFDKKTFYECIDYCERRYYPLFPYQKFIYAFVFMYEKENHDITIFSTFFIEMARGNGKDGSLMPLMNFLQSPYYGVKNYHIDIVATSEDQAQNSFKVVYDMLENNKVSMLKHFYWNKEEIINRKTGAILRYNTSNAKTKDGKQTGAILFNEYHAYETSAQVNVFGSGLGKIKHGRTFIITTDGDVRDGPLDEILSICKTILNGENNLLGYFPFICKMDDKKEVDIPMKKFLETNDKKDIDITLWCKANPSLRFMPILENQVIKDYLETLAAPSKKQEFYTKRMNLPMRNEEITITSWENILKACYEDMENKTERKAPKLNGKMAVVGIDFASFQDFTSAGFLFKVDNEYIWRQKTWICSRSKFFNEIKFPFDNQGEKGFQDFEIVDEDFIDERLMVGWVVEEMKKYQVQKIIMDTHRFLLLKKTFEDFGVDAESRDNKDGMIRMIRFSNSIYNIYAPKIEKEFVEGNINLGDSAIMRWSINNTAMKKSKDGNLTYEKIEPKLRKNDSFMAFVHAMSGHELLEEEVIFAYY